MRPNWHPIVRIKNEVAKEGIGWLVGIFYLCRWADRAYDRNDCRLLSKECRKR